MTKLRTPGDLGTAVRSARQTQGLKAVEIARRSGKSRDILHRLEAGHDVSVSSLFDILRAMNLSLRLVPAGTPTMEEVRARFEGDDETS